MTGVIIADPRFASTPSVAAPGGGELTPPEPAVSGTVASAEQPPEPTPYELAHERILAAWCERTGHKAGAFYLLDFKPPADPPATATPDEVARARAMSERWKLDWSRAARVEGEPELEAEWRRVVAGDVNPDHILVILPH